tara:strand:+ start:1170 stop:1328 length:159 start_codon:yes stop_codon:yes gene_type:complete
MKKFLLMLFWMSVAGGGVIIIDSYFEIPDEVSGILYFISIGIAASSVLNYYK